MDPRLRRRTTTYMEVAVSQIVAFTKGLSGEIHQNRHGEVSLHMITGTGLPQHDEALLLDALRAALESARIVLAMKGIL